MKTLFLFIFWRGLCMWNRGGQMVPHGFDLRGGRVLLLINCSVFDPQAPWQLLINYRGVRRQWANAIRCKYSHLHLSWASNQTSATFRQDENVNCHRWCPAKVTRTGFIRKVFFEAFFSPETPVALPWVRGSGTTKKWMRLCCCCFFFILFALIFFICQAFIQTLHISAPFSSPQRPGVLSNPPLTFSFSFNALLSCSLCQKHN